MNNNNKFVGIAYWSVSDVDADWLVQAHKTLMPLETAGIAVLGYDCLPGGDQLSVQFGDEHHKMLITDGQGRGVVRMSRSAMMFVVCLLAIKRAVGYMSVVTDSQDEVPIRLRSNHPLFNDDWAQIVPIAQQLGLVSDESFMTTHAAVLNNVF